MPSPATTQALIDSLGGLVTVVQQLKNELGTLTAGAKQSGDGARAGASAFASLTAMMGPVGEAVNVVKGSFDSLAGTLRPFVEAFSPSAVLVFDQAMRDLSAVIGSAVLPVFNVLTGVVQQVGAILLPVFQQLQPVVQQLAGTFAQLAADGLDNFALLLAPLQQAAEMVAGLAQALAPVSALVSALGGVLMSLMAPFNAVLVGLAGLLVEILRPLMDILGAMTPIFKAVTVIFQGIAEAVRVAFGKMGGGANQLKDAFGEVAKAAILAAAGLAKILRLDGFIDGMIKALGGNRQSARGFAAPQDARVGTEIGGFDKELRALAVTATPGGGLKTEEQRWRDETIAALRSIKDGKADVQKTIDAATDRAAAKIVEAVKGEVYKTVLNRSVGLVPQVIDAYRRR